MEGRSRALTSTHVTLTGIIADHLLQEAIDFSRNSKITHFLAVGGGSSMDTAKAANLFVNYPDADMFDFINAPIGKGKPIDRKLSPLVCSRFPFTYSVQYIEVVR